MKNKQHHLNSLSIHKWILVLFIGTMLSFSSSSCSRKVGCKVNDQAQIGGKVGKNGKLSTKRGSSALFPKKMKKKRKKRN